MKLYLEFTKFKEFVDDIIIPIITQVCCQSLWIVLSSLLIFYGINAAPRGLSCWPVMQLFLSCVLFRSADESDRGIAALWLNNATYCTLLNNVSCIANTKSHFLYMIWFQTKNDFIILLRYFQNKTFNMCTSAGQDCKCIAVVCSDCNFGVLASDSQESLTSRRTFP